MQDRTARGRAAFGTKNGQHTRPDRRTHGDRNGARLHPETRRGERNGRAKLTESDVRAIREARAAGSTVADLARQYGVSEFSIYGAVSRLTWRNVQ